MNILFVHQNFPGQYRHLAPALQAVGHTCMAVGGPGAPGLRGVPMRRYRPESVATRPGHPWAEDLQTKCTRAEAVARLVHQLLVEGFQPGLVIGHPGWGELLAIKDVLPGVPVLHHLEFVYQLDGADVGYDPGVMPASAGFEAIAQRIRLRLRRAPQLLALHDLDRAWAPTHWQAATAPSLFADRITVIHEGIDTDVVRPNAQAEVRLERAGLTFRPGDELVTFVARNLEPYRGFHVFMRSLPELMRLRPRCHVLIVGGDGVSYGAPPQAGGTWRALLLRELNGQLDHSRLHFVGRVPLPVLHQLFQVTACHVYLTYPFVLGWSMLEAMSCGALIVGSSTTPVEEVIDDGVNGLLVDFFDSHALACRIAEVLSNPAGFASVAREARQTIIHSYDLQGVCLPKQLQMVEHMGDVQS